MIKVEKKTFERPVDDQVGCSYSASGLRKLPRIWDLSGLGTYSVCGTHGLTCENMFDIFWYHTSMFTYMRHVGILLNVDHYLLDSRCTSVSSKSVGINWRLADFSLLQTPQIFNPRPLWQTLQQWLPRPWDAKKWLGANQYMSLGWS